MARRPNPFPGVTRIVDRHGKVRWRFRVTRRPSCYLPGVFGSVEWIAAYEAAMSGKIVPASPVAFAHGSFDWLIEQYQRTPKWAALSPISRKNLGNEIVRFRAAHGHRLIAEMRPKHVEMLIGKHADRLAAANSLLKLLPRLCRFAIRREIIKTDPTFGVESFATNPDGYHTWTDDEILRFEAHHGSDSKPFLCLRLMLYTGAARQDLVALGWQNVRAGRIAYRRKKTGGDVDLPILPPLDEALRRLPADRMLFVTWGPRGQGYSAAAFGNWFRDQCVAAGLPHCSAHGLRKAGATRLGNAGATELELQAYLGHRTPDEARTYVKKANRARLGDSGMRKLMDLSNAVERLDNYGRKAMKDMEN